MGSIQIDRIPDQHKTGVMKPKKRRVCLSVAPHDCLEDWLITTQRTYWACIQYVSPSFLPSPSQVSLFSIPLLFSSLSLALPTSFPPYPLITPFHRSFLTTLTPRPISTLSSALCTGLQNDSNGCDCSLFVPKKLKAHRCKACGHHLISHPKSSPSPLSLALPLDTNPATATIKQDHSKYVTRLLKSFEATAVHEDARKETLQSFRPPPSAVVHIPLYFYAYHSLIH